MAISIEPISGALGAVVRGVDLAAPLDDTTFAAVHAAFLDRLVLVFPDQRLTPEQHKAFGRRFGPLNVHDFVPGLPEHPEIIEVRKDADDRGYNFGGTWHTDVSYLERPSLGSLLYALEVPPNGGDTLFANMYLAWDALSDGMRALLEGLRAVHCPRASYGAAGRIARQHAAGSGSMRIDTGEHAEREWTHPVARTHPETGRRLLYVNPNFTVRFENMTEAESRPLLDHLFAHQQRPEFACRVRWSPGAVAFWDNRVTQHLAINDYHGHARRMHRVTIEGDVPR